MKKKIYKYKLNNLSYSLSTISTLNYGNYGILSLTNGLINHRHIENLRRKLSKQFKKLNNINKTKIYIKFNVWKPYTQKPMLSRMGKGAGPITHWESLTRKGSIFIELSTIENYKQVKIIIKKSIKNFPLKVILVKKKLG